jgi:hypothetical protein
LHLSKIAYISCNVCTVTFIACDKYNVAYIAYIAYIACKKETLCLRLSKFLKTHQKREAGLKVCPKCFFRTTVNRFILFYCFAFLIKKEKRNEKRDSSYTAKYVSSSETRTLKILEREDSEALSSGLFSGNIKT